MNLFDKIKLLLWFNKLGTEVTKMDKIQGMLGKLDGVKSVLGLLAVVAYYALPQYTNIQVPDVVLKIGTGMAGLGLAHKLEKGAGLLTKGLDVLGKILDVTKKSVDALNQKQGDGK